MGAYNRTNGEACNASPYLQHILREEWGFEGHFVSDCWALRDIHESHHITKNAAESAALALKNGCDLNCGCTYNHLIAALNKGLVTEEDITRSAVRLFTTRFMLGMFDETEWDSLGIEDIDTPEHHELAIKAAAESFVLLKNDGILPLKSVRSLAVIGPNADNRVALSGNYHGTASRYITPLEGIEDEAWKRGIKVRYSLGCPLLSHHDESLAKEDDRFSEALEAAKSSDAVILVLGLDETLEGELSSDLMKHLKENSLMTEIPVSDQTGRVFIFQVGRKSSLSLYSPLVSHVFSSSNPAQLQIFRLHLRNALRLSTYGILELLEEKRLLTYFSVIQHLRESFL